MKHGGGGIIVWYNKLKLCSGNERQEAIFQQDNASAKTTMSWLELHSLTVVFWPGQSPDLNPIENIWSRIKAKLVGKIFRCND